MDSNKSSFNFTIHNNRRLNLRQLEEVYNHDFRDNQEFNHLMIPMLKDLSEVEISLD